MHSPPQTPQSEPNQRRLRPGGGLQGIPRRDTPIRAEPKAIETSLWLQLRRDRATPIRAEPKAIETPTGPHT